MTRLGDYELIERIGQGGMGTVYKARHSKLKRVVALKMLPRNRLKNSEVVARFEREMEAVGRLDHPSIVRATDAREVGGVRFLVMEYVDGLDLSEVVKRSGPLRLADACEVIRQAAQGLACSHENGLVHRDVKPSNLMLSTEGQVKVLDLGLAYFHEAESLGGQITGIGQVMGTPDYLSPEQAVESHMVDIRTDVYSLGCTLYHLLAGYAPFSGPDYDTPMKKVTGHMRDPVAPIHLVRPEVPKAVQTLLERMLAKDAEQRFASPSQVASVLAPFCQGSKLLGLLREAQRQAPGASTEQISSIETDGLRASSDVDTSRTERPGKVESAKPSDEASFDPYHRWLAIPPQQQPANHYQLLGLYRFEDDPEVIRDAAARQIAHVRTYQLGQHALLSQKILNELAAAKVCLIDRTKKSAYDALLRQQLRSPAAETDASEPEQLSTGDEITVPGVTTESKSAALSRRTLRWTAAGIVGVLLLGALGIILRIDTGRGSVKITLNDPSADVEVKVDGDVIEIAGLNEPLRLHAGPHNLIVRGPNYETVAQSFTVRRGGKTVLTVDLVPKPEALARQVHPTVTPETLHRALKETNTDYTGNGQFTVASDRIVEATLVGCRIRDVTPLRGLPLRRLDARDNTIADLSPLLGMPLQFLDLTGNKVSDLSPLRESPIRVLLVGANSVEDLSPLEGMSIERLDFSDNKTADLSPLKGMPLAELLCERTGVSDLSPLRGMPLATLVCNGNRISDLSPLRDLRLRTLWCAGNQISDLSPLRGMPLESLSCINNPFHDLSPLRGMPLQDLDCTGTNVSDLEPLVGMPLVRLGIGGLEVENLNPLREVPLRVLAFSPQKCGDFGFLRSKPTLKSIIIDLSLHYENGAIPASEFWKKSQ